MSQSQKDSLTKSVKAAFGSAADYSEKQGFGQRSRLLRGIANAEVSMSGPEALSAAINLINQFTGGDYNFKSKVVAALTNLRSRLFN